MAAVSQTGRNAAAAGTGNEAEVETGRGAGSVSAAAAEKNEEVAAERDVAAERGGAATETTTNSESPRDHFSQHMISFRAQHAAQHYLFIKTESFQKWQQSLTVCLFLSSRRRSKSKSPVKKEKSPIR